MHPDFKAIPVTLVGLTGGIGAGKSTIVPLLREMNIPVFDCDEAVKGYYQDPSVIQELTERFGEQGEDAKATMAKMAWADPEVRKQLEELFTQRIMQDFWDFKSTVAENFKDGPRPVAVIDAPTLFEHGMENLVDRVVSIIAPESDRYERVKNRPGMTEEKFAAVTASQIGDMERMNRSTFTIHNTGTIEEVLAETRMIFNRIIERSHEGT